MMSLVNRWLRRAIIFLAASEAGYMALDGIRALIVGDYITPPGGQLGPWSTVAAAVGISPRSTLMKGVFAGYGLGWAAIIVAYAARAPWAWPAMLLAAALSLWYLPVGTLFSVLVTGLLLMERQDTRG